MQTRLSQQQIFTAIKNKKPERTSLCHPGFFFILSRRKIRFVRLLLFYSLQLQAHRLNILIRMALILRC